MANAFIAGWKSRFKIGGTFFAVTNENLDWQVTSEDITHSEANGFRVPLDGVESFTGTIDFVYDIDNKPTVAPQDLSPRTYANLIFSPDGTDQFTALCLCTKFSWKGGPKAGALTCTVTVESSGPITVPT